MCVARCSGRRGQQCQRPSARLKVFSRSGALRTESPRHWVTGGGGNLGPSPVPGHGVTTTPQGRLSPEVLPSRLGAETESLLQGWGVAGQPVGATLVSPRARAQTGLASLHRSPRPPQEPAPGRVAPRPGSPLRATYASPSLTLWSLMTQSSRPPLRLGA